MMDYHTFDHDGRRFRLVHDDQHETRGSYGLATEAETTAAEDEEIAKLESGEWIVLGCIVAEPCTRAHGEHCQDCNGWDETDSCWGIVIQDDYATVEAYVRTMF